MDIETKYRLATEMHEQAIKRALKAEKRIEELEGMPQTHDEAQARIKYHVLQIEMISDEWGYDPTEWLVEEGG